MSNQDWDRLLNPFRYDSDGNLTEAAQQQDLRMRLNTAGDSRSAVAAPVAPAKSSLELDSPHELTAGAGIARDLAKDLKDANTKGGTTQQSMSDHADGVAKTFDGTWTLGKALKSATAVWNSQVDALHGTLTDVAKALDDTVRTHRDHELDLAAQARGGREA
ncbi:hypothetical protein GCM10027168_73400 [Streptomyces capparidis]